MKHAQMRIIRCDEQYLGHACAPTPQTSDQPGVAGRDVIWSDPLCQRAEHGVGTIT